MKETDAFVSCVTDMEEEKAMQYFYAIMWFAVGLILIFSMSKENKIFLLAGGFFLLLGGWWLADALLPETDLFTGGWGIALKCITGGALAILAGAFVKEYRKKGRDVKKNEDSKESRF